MLDDLKMTVSPEAEHEASLSSYRNSSRSESQSTTRLGVEDAGRMKHHHKEYTSPDKSTRIVSDQYEYDSGDNDKFHKKVMKSTYSSYKISGSLSDNIDNLRRGPPSSVMESARGSSDYNETELKVLNASQKLANKLVDALSVIGDSSSHSKYKYANGKPRANYESSIMDHDHMDGEVRKIVWRNRFEKTYETQDSTPSMTIEEDARKQKNKIPIPSLSPQVLSRGEPWVDPIPFPTPREVSPTGEHGVAYIYTYGDNEGSQIQHLPPLNYVAIPVSKAGKAVPIHQSGTQPIIYHISYHYTLHPGQCSPDEIPKPGHHQSSAHRSSPGTVTNTDPLPQTSRYQNHYSSTSSEMQHHHQMLQDSSKESVLKFPKQVDTTDEGDRNVSITINKTTRTHTHTKECPDDHSSTSHLSRSPSPIDRAYRHYGTRTYNSDSLERLRKPQQESMPFPDTSPIRPPSETQIPYSVDELMTSFSDSEDGLDLGANTKLDSVNYQPLSDSKQSKTEAETGREIANDSQRRVTIKKNERTQNVDGPPVYYPPGHQQLFNESMHTMTLKEKKRRGLAKWRMERESGMKASSSSAQSKSGMALVPVCLPLCCGAACAIM